MIIAGETSLEVWKESLKRIMKEGTDFYDENKRLCREIISLLTVISHPEKEITKPINILNTFEEWKYPPLGEIKEAMLNPETSPEYHYSYGPRIFNFQKKIDQINRFILPLLSKTPISRRASLCLFDPSADSDVNLRDTPGLLIIDFKLRDKKLHLHGFIRSCDFFFGWPANIYQLSVIQDYVREKLAVSPGKIFFYSSSAHLFEDQFDYIKEIIRKF